MPDGIADVLRQAILSGELSPGVPLREMQLAAELGVSRAPLREALRMLEEEGLAERRPFKGSAVAIVPAREVQEIAVVRRRVESLAVQLGLERLQADGAAELRAAVARLSTAAAAEDIAASIDAHLAIHRMLYDACGNEVLADMWRSWESRLRLFWVVDHRSFTTLTDVADSHTRLLDLIVAGDMEALHTELRTHIHGRPGDPAEVDAVEAGTSLGIPVS